MNNTNCQEINKIVFFGYVTNLLNLIMVVINIYFYLKHSGQKPLEKSGNLKNRNQPKFSRKLNDREHLLDRCRNNKRLINLVNKVIAENDEILSKL